MNNKGLSLVEVLGVLALLSMILLLAISVHLFGQKQLKSQIADIENHVNVRLAINMITKEIRSAENVSVNNNILTINNADVYMLDGTTLKKNNAPFITNIKKFAIEKNGNKITLSIENIPQQNEPPVSRTVTIYIRKVVNI
jgi:Tfp pilus assembly protein PilW